MTKKKLNMIDRILDILMSDCIGGEINSDACQKTGDDTVVLHFWDGRRYMLKCRQQRNGHAYDPKTGNPITVKQLKACDITIGTPVCYQHKHTDRINENHGVVIANTSRQGDECVVIEFDDDHSVHVVNVNDLIILSKTTEK